MCLAARFICMLGGLQGAAASFDTKESHQQSAQI